MSETPKVDAPGTLYQRGNRYSWKIKVPPDLAHLPQYLKQDGTTKQNAEDVSLGTADRAVARAKGVALASEWSIRFAAERRALEVQSPNAIPPALVDAIAQRVRVAVLAEDERVRADPVALAQWLLPWWDAQERARRSAHEREHPERRYGPRAVPDELTPEGIEELKRRPSYLGTPPTLFELLTERHRGAADIARKALALGNFGPFVMIADREAKALGVNLGADGWLPDHGPLSPIHDACRQGRRTIGGVQRSA
jgi:hypothetical protein